MEILRENQEQLKIQNSKTLPITSRLLEKFQNNSNEINQNLKRINQYLFI